jgi:hypothetical protein
VDFDQLFRTLSFLGLPEDFTLLIFNLYSRAWEFVAPHCHTSLIEVRRGTL